MSTKNHELPIIPTSAPAVLSDNTAAIDLFTDVLERLAAVVDVTDEQLELPTPCADFTVDALQKHVLGWLDFFAAALSDPDAETSRPDPESFTLTDGRSAAAIVTDALAAIREAIAADVARQLVTMTGSRTSGDGVLAMALGEYIIHAWDLATATGRQYSAPETAVRTAHEFQGILTPQYRGPETAFFGTEVQVAEDASPLEQLIGFAGRDPHWQAP